MSDSRPSIRVVVVDDSAFARKVVREALEADPRFEVVGTARDGLDALEKISALKPDVVTLDLVMPNLDGVGVLKALPTLDLEKPPRVVVVTMSEDSSDVAVSALQSGAVALVHKPTALASEQLYELAGELREAVAAAAPAAPPRVKPTAAPVPPRPLVGRTSERRAILIGASTGGPQAVTFLLSRVPADFPVPILVVLHMPIGYTEALSRRLDHACAIEVVEAHEGVELRAGRAIIARGGMHLKVEPGAPAHGRLDLAPFEPPHRPSVDVLFESAAEAFGERCVGVVLTGMGNDGTAGARALRGANAVVLTEAESSCVVYGMPRAVKEAGLSTREVPLEEMLSEIERWI